MPYTSGVASDYHDLLAKLVTWATDSTIHGNDAWTLVRNDPWPRGTILRAKGLGPNDIFYVGFMPLDIVKGQTYQKWLAQESVFGPRMIWSPRYLNRFGCDFVSNGMSAAIDLSGPFATTKTYLGFSFSPEIFACNAKVMFLGAFKQYEDGLNWDELPGAPNLDRDIGMQRSHATIGSSQTLYEPPLMPGVGHPAFGMNDNYPIDGILNYWFIKDASRITIVTHHTDFTNYGDYWDVGHIGLLIPFGTTEQQSEFPFPAVVIGPTSGAVAVGKNDSLGYGNFANVGIMFDYSYKNWSLVRSVPTFPTAPADTTSTISQMMVCPPNGYWGYVVNWIQGVKQTLIPNTTSYYFSNAVPTLPTTAFNFYMRPTKTDIDCTINPYELIDDPEHPEIVYQLEPLEIVQATSGQQNMLGKVKGIYWPSIKPKEYGEVVINGKKCLMLPNCWGGRRWYYPDGFTGVYDPSQLLQQYNQITTQSLPMNCLVRLED